MTPSFPVSDRPGPGSCVNIFIPRPEWEAEVSLSIAPRSGIVGYECEPGKLLLYYEGNLYGASNLKRWEERVHQAYGRLVQRYPTVAKMVDEAHKYQCVGTITDGVVRVVDHAALDRWCPPAPARPRP